MFTRIDLADGVEDGAMGPDQTKRAPRCSSCGNPINPKRPSCVYCDAVFVEEEAPAPRPPRQVACKRCGKNVPETDTYFSERGLVCSPCHWSES